MRRAEQSCESCRREEDALQQLLILSRHGLALVRSWQGFHAGVYNIRKPSLRLWTLK